MSDFTKWINEFITPGEPHAILPGCKVHLGVQATPVGLTAAQATEMANRLLNCASVAVAGRWPDDELERQMLADAEWVMPAEPGAEFVPDHISDLGCHVRALLGRVRELEAELNRSALENITLAGKLRLAREGIGK